MGDPAVSQFEAYDRYIDEHFDAMVAELREVCSRPTLAGQRVGIDEGTRLVRGLLEPLGARVKEVPLGDAPPLMIGELGAGDRTLLLYNHYDVQPPEPLELWDSPPYAGDVRDGHFYARGVADDRGDFFSRVLAFRAYRATVGDLPLRIRWMIEGEEEIGSPSLGPAVEQHAEELRADWCAWESSWRDTDNRPMVICGLKGVLYVELHAKGPAYDVHSLMGGVVPNPAWRLVLALATLRDERGNFVMDGLDELVAPPSDADLAVADATPFNEEAVLELFGLTAWQRGLRGREVPRSVMFEPTANIAGFTSGYSGEGAKTIIPSTATVKIDFRLVPNQTPERMLELLRGHLDRRGFTDIEIVKLGDLLPAKTPVDHPLVQVSIDTWRDLGDESAYIAPMTGGSGPLSLITGLLGIPTVMAGGVAFADSRAHAPNESIRLQDFKQAIRYWGRFIHRLASAGA